jgi:hypothetical protein
MPWSLALKPTSRDHEDNLRIASRDLHLHSLCAVVPMFHARIASLNVVNCRTCLQNHPAPVPPKTCQTPQPFKAQYTSTCNYCLESISVGERIARGVGGCFHVPCAALSLHSIDRNFHSERIAPPSALQPPVDRFTAYACSQQR